MGFQDTRMPEGCPPIPHPVLFWICQKRAPRRCENIVDLNLETLKNEILSYLENSDFAVFRSHAGGLEGLPVITWDTERCPDYRAFLDTARKAGEKLILFASRELAEDELDEAMEELVETEFGREERRDLEARMTKAQKHIGSTCSLELAFGHNSHLYVYEVRPDWYEDFLDACEEISAVLSIDEGIGDDNEDAGDGLRGGFYSNN
jgi:hypothetical protein